MCAMFIWEPDNFFHQKSSILSSNPSYMKRVYLANDNFTILGEGTVKVEFGVLSWAVLIAFYTPGFNSNSLTTNTLGDHIEILI